MRPNAGDGANFKLTADERAKIEDELRHCNLYEGYIEHVINRFESIINEGWQTCECELTQPK